MNKKILLICAGIAVVVVATVCLLFANSGNDQSGEKLNVVTSFNAMTEFATAVGGDKVNVSTIIPDGAEPHEFEPKATDLVALSAADVFVYNGLGMETWADKAIESANNNKLVSVIASKGIETITLTEEQIEEHSHAHAEFDEADIEKRPLSDFAGDWKDCSPYLKDGTVDPYFEHASKEMNKTSTEVKEMYIKMMRTDYPSLSVTADGISVGNKQAKATYKGFYTTEGEHGNSVWYEFETDGTAGVPKYWVFNDHQHTVGVPESEVAHIHALYSDDSFGAIFAIENWAAMYFTVSATPEQILSAMMDHNHDEHGEFDPHSWLSLKNAISEVNAIKDAFVKADERDKDYFERNALEYTRKLQTLYNDYKTKFASATSKVFVTGHAAFGYLARDFGLTQNSVEGVFAEGEPSPSQLAELVEYCKDNGVKVIFAEEMVSPEVSATLAHEVGAKVETIYTIESAEDNLSYIDRLTSNLDKIYNSLNVK
jgi:ABC-type Zn uptake system ZnuABC Zn-binding protein ZnuA